MRWAIACGIGAAAWGEDAIELAALIVPVWGLSRSRLDAFVCMFAYYAAGSRSVPSAAATFFGAEHSQVAGLALWLAASMLLAIPWAALYGLSWRPARALGAIALTALPPIGLIGWLNPLLGASSAVAGYGPLSLVAGASIIVALALCGTAARQPRWKLSAAALAAVVVTVGAVAQRPAAPGLDGWVAVQAHAGPAPTQFTERWERLELVTRETLTHLRQGARVIVFPEQHLGVLSIETKPFLEAALGQPLRKAGAVMVIGAAVPTGVKERTTNSALIYDGYGWAQHDARVAVPISMVRPWADDSTEIRPLGRGSVTIAGQRVLMSMCYEDMMVWPHLVDLVRQRHDAVVSIANGWWVGDSGAGRVQQQHIEAWARIFALPLVRSVNSKVRGGP